MLGKPSEIHRFQVQNHRINLANPYDFGVNTLNQQATWAFLKNGGVAISQPKTENVTWGPTLLMASIMVFLHVITLIRTNWNYHS